MPGAKSQEHGGSNRSRFASGMDRLVDLMRTEGRATSRATGGGPTGAASSEASDAVNKPVVVLDAVGSAGGEHYLSATLIVGVDDKPFCGRIRARATEQTSDSPSMSQLAQSQSDQSHCRGSTYRSCVIRTISKMTLIRVSIRKVATIMLTIIKNLLNGRYLRKVSGTEFLIP